MQIMVGGTWEIHERVLSVFKKFNYLNGLRSNTLVECDPYYIRER